MIFWGSSFKDGTTQTVRDPPLKGTGPVRTHSAPDDELSPARGHPTSSGPKLNGLCQLPLVSARCVLCSLELPALSLGLIVQD